MRWDSSSIDIYPILFIHSNTQVSLEHDIRWEFVGIAETVLLLLCGDDGVKRSEEAGHLHNDLEGIGASSFVGNG